MMRPRQTDRHRRQPGPTWALSTEDGFIAMYDATVNDVYQYARRLTANTAQAEDLVQQVYLELLQTVRAGGLRHIGMGRLIVAVRCRFLDSIRKRERDQHKVQMMAVNASRDGGVDLTDPVDAAHEFLDEHGLSDRERAALTLRYIEDLPVPEVASALGTTVRATESLLARARSRIRNTEARHA